MPKSVSNINAPGRRVEPSTEHKTHRGRKVGAVYFPRHSLAHALKVAKAIYDDNQGEPYNTVRLASQSLELSPKGSPFIMLLASSFRYELTEGNAQSEKIILTPLARTIVSSTNDVDIKTNLRTALLKPDVFQKIYNRLDNHPIPRDGPLKDILQELGVPKGDSDACYKVIMENIADYVLAQDVKGTKYLLLENLSPNAIEPSNEPDVQEEGVITEEKQYSAPISAIEEKRVPKQIFVAHGKNKKPLEQLRSILNQFKVPFQVAIDEPHKGKVISAKVLDLMHQCSSGIFIFTGDEDLTDSEGEKVVRPNDNVVFELGAGVALYGDKIVILREEGVTFGSDFDSYGRITFEKDKLDARGLDVMKELIGMGFLQVQPA